MWLGDGFLSSFSKDNNANFWVKKKCNEAFRGVYTRTNFKSNLILVAVLVLESKGLSITGKLMKDDFFLP